MKTLISTATPSKKEGAVPDYSVNLDQRKRAGLLWRLAFQAATLFGILALVALLLNIMDSSFSYAALQARVEPATLAVDGVPLEEQTQAQLVALLRSELSAGAFTKLDNEKPFAQRSRADVYQLVLERIVRYDVQETWSLGESLTQAAQIKAAAASEYPEAQLKFINWLNADFVQRPQTSEALTTGIRTAVLGSLWTIFFTILFAFPIGVGAAVFLEE